MNILDHVWGVSPAQDRVWAQVSGLRPSLTAQRLSVVFQAFIDDSTDETGNFVLAGYIAPVENWARFAKDWEEMLPHGLVDNDGRRYFKMSEMAASKERMSRVPWFYRTIEKHVVLAIACVVNLEDVRRAQKRVYTPDGTVHWNWFNNRFIFTFRALMDMFHVNKTGEELETLIPASEKVDFIFDNQSEKRLLLETWERYLELRDPVVRERFGATPRFEDDKGFLPLQAADFWAWWVRKWGGVPTELGEFRFDWEMLRPIPGISIEFDEEQLFTAHVDSLRRVSPGIRIFDLKTQLEV